MDKDKLKPKDQRVCFNIDTSQDSFLHGKTDCLPFTRSDAVFTHDNIRQQFNIITAYLDASNVYGSDVERASKLRTKSNGTMKTHELGHTLPARHQCEMDASSAESTDDLIAGDIRAIEQPGLASMHSLFLMEHNRLADDLREHVEDLNDEDIYQVARMIVTAQLQNIIFSEFLPIVLGNTTMKKFGLTLPEDKGENTVYQPSVDPTLYSCTHLTSAANFCTYPEINMLDYTAKNILTEVCLPCPFCLAKSIA